MSKRVVCEWCGHSKSIAKDVDKAYAKGRADAIDEFYNALTSKRCECCNAFRNECDKCGKCFIDEIAEQLKEKSNV